MECWGLDDCFMKVRLLENVKMANPEEYLIKLNFPIIISKGSIFAMRAVGQNIGIVTDIDWIWFEKSNKVLKQYQWKHM